jgi:hypothetical protein
MERQPVISSNIKSIGFDKETTTLEIEFKNGTVYRYEPISEDTYLELIQAESVGKYFNQHIKNASGINVERI